MATDTPTRRRLPLASEPLDAPAAPGWARGWYFVAFAEDVAKGRVRAVELFGQDWALFRTERGEVALLAAQCCHLGADLGRTGEVVGEHLRCALHHWEFACSGACVVAPRVRRIPQRARQRRLAVTERLGGIWCWWGSNEPAPFADTAGLEGDGYINRRGERYEGVGDPRTIMEHSADFYHLEFHHQRGRRHNVALVANEGTRLEYEVTFEQPPWAARLGLTLRSFNEFIGPCASIYRLGFAARPPRERPIAAMLLGVTPVHAHKTLLAWRMIAPRAIDRAPFGLIDAAIVEATYRWFRKNVHADLEILKTIRRLERPLWVEPDGPTIRAYRAFYDRQCEAAVEHPEERAADPS